MGKRKSTGPVRFAVIGVAGMGRHHCISISQLRETQLTAVCDVNPAAARKAARTHNVPSFLSHKDLIKSKLCDAVVVATPHPVRPPIAIDCMNARLHLLSEKPLAERVSAAGKMIAAANKTGVAFGIMFQRRCEPEIAKAIEIARSGRLGKIHRATLISPEYRTQAYYDSGTWRATWAGEGGGVMMNQAPHILDIFTQLAGMPRSVTGNIDTRLHRIEVEDVAEAMLSYPDGGTGYLYCSTNECGPGQMIELFGDKGKLIYRQGELRLFLFGTPVAQFTKRTKRVWAAPRCREVDLRIPAKRTRPVPLSTHAAIIRNFARHILYGEKLIAPGQDGLASLELANAITLSSYRNAPVSLPLDRRAYDAFLAQMRARSKGKRRPAKVK